MPNGYAGGHGGMPLYSTDGGEETMVDYTCTVCDEWGTSMSPEDAPKEEFIMVRCPGCNKETRMKREQRRGW